VKKSIGVSPQVIVDTLNVSLNAAELAYLSQGNKDNLLKTILYVFSESLLTIV
jgi:hypothetical protein